MTPQEIYARQKMLYDAGLLSMADWVTGPGIYGPKTTAADIAYKKQMEENIRKTAEKNPVIAAQLPRYGTFEEMWGATGGDLSRSADVYGTPFSIADQKAAEAQGMADVAGAQGAETQYETQTAADALAQKQADYQNYLATQATKFENEKSAQDQEAANQGVLFSGGRVQKLQTLGDTYSKDQAYKQASYGRDIGATARDYEYKYGTDAANSLSKYYNLGGQTYNPNVATGGVGSTGLSSIYSTGQGDYQGTRVNAYKAEAQKRAAGYLWNKGNKLVKSGLNNQYK